MSWLCDGLSFYILLEGFPNNHASGTELIVCVKHPVWHQSVVDGEFGEDGPHGSDQREQEFKEGTQAALTFSC